MRTSVLTLACLLLVACGSASPAGSGSGSTGGTAGSGSTSGTTGGSGSSGSGGSTGGSSGSSTGSTGIADAGCFTPRPPDATRAVVISLPFAADGGPAPDYEVLTLDSSGTMATTGVRFQMHNATSGRIAFTPDGRFGFVAQEDGSIGEFELSGIDVTVRNPGLSPGFYARQLVVSPDGNILYGIDEDTLANGGGLYAMSIGCDGTLSAATQLGTFNTPNAFAMLNGSSQFAISGGALPDGGNQDDFYQSDTRGQVLGETALFSTHDAIASAVAVTRDDGYALVADDGYFAGSRLAVARLDASGPVAVDVLSTPNPADVVTSPFDNTALVLNSDGQDALTRLAFDPSNAAHPFALDGHITYVAAHPQLPAEAVVLQRGALRGRVLVGELSGVRQVQFEPDGGIADLSLFTTGPDLTDIVGALGVQP